MDSETVAQLQDRLHARDEQIRESWVRAMEVKIVRDELTKCQRTEGVNHYENCKSLAEKYLQMLRENRVKGYKQVDV
ncbi:hypothetical protein ACEPAH_7969 [Sanghuangporus vaninii]